MVFFPMLVYGLLKCLLNINSGYTLIVSNVILFSFKSKRTVSSYNSKQENWCCEMTLHITKTSFSCTHRIFTCANHFYMEYFQSS